MGVDARTLENPTRGGDPVTGKCRPGELQVSHFLLLSTSLQAPYFYSRAFLRMLALVFFSNFFNFPMQRFSPVPHSNINRPLFI